MWPPSINRFRVAGWQRSRRLGNHDYGPGWGDPEIAANIADAVRSCGITVLRNEMLDAEGLQIVGLDDLWAKRFNPQDVLRSLT